MTILSVNLMWAIVLFGILLWTTACVTLNAALRRGMRIMGLVLSYGVLAWMVVALPWREVVVTWGIFAAVGGALSVVYELWARRRYAGTGRRSRRLIRPEGLVKSRNATSRWGSSRRLAKRRGLRIRPSLLPLSGQS